MPQAYTYETAIALDHEANECRVDTTVRSIATQLRRRGFVEITKPNSAPYQRFLGQADQVRFRAMKGNRGLRGIAKKKAGNLLSESVRREDFRRSATS